MGKYDAWDNYFAGIESDDFTVDMAELERAIRTPLPPSARRYAEWWASAHYYAKWVSHGLVASPDLAQQQVRFRRRTPKPGRPPRAVAADSVPGGEARLLLLGCVAEKGPSAALARDLYLSPLWEKRCHYAEASGKPWAILSAEHGLVMPDQVIEPYDRSLKDESSAYQREWSRRTAQEVIERCRRLGVDAVEVHAGAAYLENGLIGALNDAALRVVWPLRSMRIGEQLQWYDTKRRPKREAPAPPPQPRPGVLETPSDPELRITQMAAIGPFDYRWPDTTEHFEHGWEGRFSVEGRESGFRHGVGRRAAYAMDRIHTVTWVRGEPVVEGVAADDYLESLGLLSLIKLADKSMAREWHQLPAGYTSLPVVNHRDEIDAPYSRSGLAVKLRVEDVSGWLRHAHLRLVGGGDVGPSSAAPEPRPLAPPPVEPAPLPSEVEPGATPLPDKRKRGIAEALAEFGRSAQAQLTDLSGGLEFTPHPEANLLLRDDPFAFLLGVLADHGMKAERAWVVPMELKRRLGHLDPHRMLSHPEAVYRAFATPPALHRFVQTMPRWYLAAAERVLADYDGDAGSIWSDSPRAADLQARLRRFEGIAQKKAAMAVEMLERDLAVEVLDMGGSDIAFDVHIRRVFLRTGLAEVDDVDHMVAAARAAYPERPGAIDTPAWVIGRRWCRPGIPDCPACVLDLVCAKRIEAGGQVRGV